MRVTKKILLLFYVLIGLIASACSSPEPTPVPTTVPTSTPVPPTATTAPTRTATIEPTRTLTVRPVGSLTPTPRPSATPLPTITPRPSATPTRTVTPSPTSTPTPIPPDWIVQTLLVGPGQPGRLYVLQTWRDSSPDPNRRLLVSDNSGATWTPFAGGLPVAPACVRNINLDYAVPDALYASTCQGVYRWSENKWGLVSSQETGMLALVYQQANIIWATGYKALEGPILRSNDGGKSWVNASTGMVHFSGIANLAVDPRDANTLYAIINPKYAGSYLRRGTANGLWQTIPTPLKNAQIDTGMTIDGATGALYVTAYDGTRSHWQLWRSVNANESDIGKIAWEMVQDFGAGVLATVLASGTSPQGAALYVRLSSANCNPGAGIPCQSSVRRSLDGGKTWTTAEIPGF